MKNTIVKVALAVIKNKKLLMVRSKNQAEKFYTLGGKIEKNETDIECIQREVKEEINIQVDLQSIKFLHEFKAPGHGIKNSLLIIRLYQGKLIGNPIPTNEIAEIQYFDLKTDKKHITEMGLIIFDWLKKKNYID